MFVVLVLLLLALVACKPPEIEFMELFAKIGAGACSEDLYYGPGSIQGSDGIYRNFLSTNTTYKDVRSRNWVQIVTSDGEYELFRIYWTFDTIKTLAEHIADAVAVGEEVSYKVVTNLNKRYEYRGVWRFSSSSGITLNTFNTATTRCCFSRTNGLWGADSGTINAADGSQRNDDSFWGQGNFRSDDSTQCHYVYMLGTAYTATQSSPVSYLYHSTVNTPTSSPTVLPTPTPSTPRPTALPSPSSQPSLAVRVYDLVHFRVTLRVGGLSVADYRASPIAHDDLFGKVLAACFTGISEHDVSTYSVTAATTTASAAVSSSIRTASSGVVDRASSAETTTEADTAVVLHSLVPAIDDLLLSPAAPSALSQVNTAALVTLTVSKENSAYTYEQLAEQLAQSESAGALNTWLYRYAVYLNIDDMSAATATVYSTQSIAADEEGSTTHAKDDSWVTPAVAGAAVLATLLAAGYCWRKGWSCQRSDQVDVGSTHSAAALDCSFEGHLTLHSTLPAEREARSWLERGVGASGIRREARSVDDVEMQYATTPSRTTTSSAIPTSAVVGSSGGRRVTGRSASRRLHSLSESALSRGAPTMQFSTPPTTSNTSQGSAGSVVEITPRSVQVMQGFNASMRHGLPVVRAHAVQAPTLTSSITTAVAALAIPAVNAVPVSERTLNGSSSSYIIAEAEVESS